MNVHQKIIQPKLGLAALAKKLTNIAAACRTLGYSRDSCYRFEKRYQQGGKKALQEISRKSVYWANSLDPAMEQAVVKMAIAQPSLWVTKSLQSA